MEWRSKPGHSFHTVGDLVECLDPVRRINERKRGRRFGARATHGLTRCFQALRIAVNRELDQLEMLLSKGPQLLAPGAALCIISFHSLEDRAVKVAFKKLAKTEQFDIDHKRGLVPSESEIERNPRARSARLRVLRRKLH